MINLLTIHGVNNIKIVRADISVTCFSRLESTKAECFTIFSTISVSRARHLTHCCSHLNSLQRLLFRIFKDEDLKCDVKSLLLISTKISRFCQQCLEDMHLQIGALSKVILPSEKE